MENILGILDVDPNDQGNDEMPLAQRRVLHSVHKRAGALKVTATRRILTDEEKQKRREQKEEQERIKAEARRAISCGVDFGTTYTGVAYVLNTKSAKDVNVVTKWQGGQYDILEKVPTRIAFAEENNFDEDKWGYDVEPGMKSCQWFKLLLDGTTDPDDFADPMLLRSLGEGSSKLRQLPPGKTAIDVATAYLTLLHHHVLRFLADRMGQANLDQIPIVWTLTTPAIWSPQAREKTREAAVAAGFQGRDRDCIAMMDEPEAASIAALRGTLDTFEEKSPFQKGKSVLCCDVGGGTVDLVTHRVVQLEPLKLEEACVGAGGRGGGTWVDRGFHHLLESRFGIAFTGLELKRVSAGSALMQRFEEYKRNFRGTHVETRTYEIPLKMRKLDEDDESLAKYYDFEEDNILITSEDMEDLFEPVLRKTSILVKRQVAGVKGAKGMPPIKTILLCGGMSASPYFQDKFREFVEDELDGDVEVVVPQKAWSAIARGAAIRGLECEKAPVLFRRARDNIGIMVHEKWDAEKHSVDDYLKCPILGDRARGAMRWLVNRGDIIRPNLKKHIDCYMVVERPERSGKVRVYQDLYESTLNNPPNRINDSVTPSTRIAMDVSSVLADMRKKRKKAGGGDGKGTLFKIPIRIQIELGATKGMFVVTAKSGRKEVGAAAVDFDSDPNWHREILWTEG